MESEKSKDKWKEKLTKEQYQVLRKKGTERPPKRRPWSLESTTRAQVGDFEPPRQPSSFFQISCARVYNCSDEKCPNNSRCREVLSQNHLYSVLFPSSVRSRFRGVHTV